MLCKLADLSYVLYVLIEHKETCFKTNGKQSIRLNSGSVFKNYFKQLAVPFKIYADFESVLKGVKSSDKNNSSYTEKYHDHIPCSFAYKIVCIDNTFSKNVVLYRGKKLLKQFLKKEVIAKK